MSPSLTLAERLCARMCHDLSNPLSALSGVLDLMRRAPTNAEAASIAEQAVRSSQDRLRLFRAAWCDSEHDIHANDIKSLTDGLHISRRVTLGLDELTGSFPAGMGRVILNILLVAVEALAGSGHIVVKGTAANGVSVRISGGHAAWPPLLATYLANPDQAWDELQTHDILPAMTAIITHATHRTIRFVPMENGPDEIILQGMSPD